WSEQTLGLRLRRGREHPPRAPAEVDDVDPALLGGVGDAMREIERLVEEARRFRGRASHRGDDRALGARRDDRLGAPLDPDPRPRAVAAQSFAERLERVDLVSADVLAEPEEYHPRRRMVVHCKAERNASATRS